MSDSVWPHRRQPTRLPHPWDSPGKNTGVGCHCLLQCMKVKSESEVAQSCPTLSDPMDCSLPGSSVHGIFQARALEWGAIGFSDMFYYYILILTYFRTSKEVGLKLDPPQKSKFKYMSKQEHLPPVVLWGKQDYIISHLFSSLMCLFFSLYFSHVLTYVWNISC